MDGMCKSEQTFFFAVFTIRRDEEQSIQNREKLYEAQASFAALRNGPHGGRSSLGG